MENKFEKPRGNFGERKPFNRNGERKPFDRSGKSFDRKPRDGESFGNDKKPRFGDKPGFDKKPFRRDGGERKPFDRPRGNFGDRKPFSKDGDRKSFDKGGKSFDRNRRSFDKVGDNPRGDRRGGDERKISTTKACVVRLEKTSQGLGGVFERTLRGLMEYFPLAVFGYAIGNDINLVFSLDSEEIYGNNPDKLITIAASRASVIYTKASGDDSHFSAVLVQPFKDKIISYFEERQLADDRGLVAFRNEKGVIIEEAKLFTSNKEYLFDKLKNVYEERLPREEIIIEKPTADVDVDKEDEATHEDKEIKEVTMTSRSFAGIDTTRSQGYRDIQAKREAKKK